MESKPPPCYLYGLIQRDGSPNRILESLTIDQALAQVTREHAAISNWIRAQAGERGWDLTNPTRAQFAIINVSRRLKLCRGELRAMQKEARWSGSRQDDGGGSVRKGEMDEAHNQELDHNGGILGQAYDEVDLAAEREAARLSLLE